VAQEGVKLSDFDLDDVLAVAASADVATVSVFPHYAAKKFIAGEPVEILLGFANNGEEEFNITHITASFNYPLDYSYFIQNFTIKEYNISVKPSTLVSLSYSFLPDALLEPRDFGLVCSVFYRDLQGTNFTSVFFNSTVDLVEPAGGVDTQTFFVVIFSIAFLGLITFLIYRFLSAWRKKQSYGPSSEQGGTTSVDDDWLAGTSADPALRKRKKQNKKENN